MKRLRLLIVEGNTAERNDQIRAQGGQVYADVYSLVLKDIFATECCVARPCEVALPDLRRQIDLRAGDGVVWTGSSLNTYGGLIGVRRQVSNCSKRACRSWELLGLQVMTVAMGGVVRRNPWGREIGIARDILVNAAGAAHPMFRGKPSRFDSVATHVDEVERLPDGCIDWRTAFRDPGSRTGS
jgi:GMP synthase (glutamine-hydrolysing)